MFVASSLHLVPAPLGAAYFAPLERRFLACPLCYKHFAPSGATALNSLLDAWLATSACFLIEPGNHANTAPALDLTNRFRYPNSSLSGENS